MFGSVALVLPFQLQKKKSDKYDEEKAKHVTCPLVLELVESVMRP